MTKMYGMPSCPDRAEVTEEIKASGRKSEFEIININEHMAYLKAFLQPHDRKEAFRPVGGGGYVGVPCFVQKDGTVSLDPVKFGL